ncbi:hypothetical protein DBR11_21560 [Pedobacter sp. HMWF019]|uniref:BACON domain-containing protein n=1 Tax=Pedobacter sp. HMWF019 TaxID=2056856 RepID=UPI000D373779|nr:BACON domain-containing protein [Pedobacter sp. HMWF019]PTS95273.1 hypothetical protein DBR11_21560 [Pedobacter sp. HMWF019]
MVKQTKLYKEMRINQNILRLLSFMFCFLVLISCKKQDLPAKPEASAFSAVLESNSAVPASGGTVNVLISTNTDGWWVSNLSASWATVNRTYGSGNFKLPVTLKANTSGAKRSINLQVNPTFNLPAITLTINQDN